MTASALTSEQHRRRSVIRQVVLWVAWIGAVISATVGMYFVRASLDKAHVTLVYLVLVLGASAAGGRALGFTVAALGFLCFDVYFLPPYATLTIANPLDWLILVAFLLTSAVATQLLYRANATAEAATARAIEVDRLAALGAETLNAADAYEALRAIAGVIRSSLDVDECDIYLDNAEKRVVLVARVLRASVAVGQRATLDAATEMEARNRATPPGRLVDWIVEHGTSAVELGDGTVRVAYESGASHDERDTQLAAALRVVTRRGDASGGRVRRLLGEVGEASAEPVDRPAVHALALPLKVRDRTVGVLRLASDASLSFTPEQARLLTALAYYAALGAERARLVATAERVEAERRVERLRSALLTAVSHDLRTPLTTIKGIANEILHGANREQAAVIESEADWLDGLVSDLLDLSRIQAGAVQPILELNTLDDLVGTALRRAGAALQGRRVDVDNPRDELLAGVFDFTQSLRALVNLLDNAAKYSPAGSPVDVRLRRRGDRLTIDVMDRGVGIPEAERGRVFESFYRPPGVPPDIRGHGLGLSIARGLAEAQGGTVWVEPRPAGGSVFTLELPAAQSLPIETEPA